jgi:hypothetical protein
MKLKDSTPEQIKNAEPQIISELLKDAKHLEKTIKVLRTRAKELIHEGVVIPDWHIKAGSKVREIPDVEEAVRLLLNEKDLDIKPSDLLAVCKLPVPKICEMIAEKTGCTKLDADMTLAGVLGDLLESKQKAGSLEQDK